MSAGPLVQESFLIHLHTSYSTQQVVSQPWLLPSAPPSTAPPTTFTSIKLIKLQLFSSSNIGLTYTLCSWVNTEFVMMIVQYTMHFTYSLKLQTLLYQPLGAPKET